MDSGKNGLNANIISKRIYKIINSSKPITRYVIIQNKIMNYILPQILPDLIFDKLIGK